jgi:brefeldin A-inhibited guanine nucleotide-exchange protein 3
MQAVHDIISSLLHHHTEMSYFHFNESLFKPFESLLLLELCDSDVQVRPSSSIF